jgi:uncharacterized protein (TIGR03086 family)
MERNRSFRFVNGEEMTSWTILDEAHEILRNAASGVPDGGWDGKTPCAEWNVGQVVQHAGLDQLLYVSSITGVEKPSEDAFAPTGHTSAAFVVDALRASSEAFATVGVDADAVPVPLPPFSVSARTSVGAAALDAAVHGWDVAVATGQPLQMSDALARELLEIAQQLVEPLRSWGAYAPAIVPPAGARDLDRLLCFLGRDAARWPR